MATKERESKGGTGVAAFTRALMKDGLGLSSETVDDLIKQIKQRGEMDNVRLHVRKLSGGTHKRFNQALDMAEEDQKKKGEEEAAGEKEPNRDKPEKKEDKKAEKKEDKKDDKKDEKKEEVKESFMHYLLKELADEDMDKKDDKGPELTTVDGMRLSKSEADRYMTMSDSQKEQFKKSKMQRTERMRKEEIRTEEKPEVKNLMRQKERLLKKLDDLNAQIKDTKGAK